MSYSCHNCGKSLDLESATSTGRRDECPHCDADLHVCLNCRYFDESVYNQCKEPQAERVLDKGRSNFCDYFEFSTRHGGESKSLSKEDQRKALDSLFK